MKHLTGLVVLTLVGIVYGIQQLVVLPRLRRELINLNSRRARRVQAALAASSAAAWTEPAIAPNHSFAGWVDLKKDGTVSVGGQIFRPTEVFEITSRDSHHISRAVVMAPGNGDVLIRSHGQVFLARYEHQSWNVQLINRPA